MLGCAQPQLMRDNFWMLSDLLRLAQYKTTTKTTCTLAQQHLFGKSAGG